MTRHTFSQNFVISPSRVVFLQLKPEHAGIPSGIGYLTISGFSCTVASSDPVEVWAGFTMSSFTSLGGVNFNNGHYTSGQITNGDDNFHIRSRYEFATGSNMWVMVNSSADIQCNPPYETYISIGDTLTHTMVCEPPGGSRTAIGQSSLLLASGHRVRFYAHNGNPSNPSWNTVVVNLGVKSSTIGTYRLYIHVGESCSDCVASNDCGHSFGVVQYSLTTANEYTWEKLSIPIPRDHRDLTGTEYSQHELSFEAMIASGPDGASITLFLEDGVEDVIEFKAVQTVQSSIVLKVFTETLNIESNAPETASDGVLVKEYIYFRIDPQTILEESIVTVNFRVLGTSTGTTQQTVQIAFVTFDGETSDPHGDSCNGENNFLYCSQRVTVDLEFTNREWKSFSVSVSHDTVQDWSAVKWVAFLVQSNAERRRRDEDGGMFIGTNNEEILHSTQNKKKKKDGDLVIIIVASVLAGCSFVGSVILFCCFCRCCCSEKPKSKKKAK